MRSAIRGALSAAVLIGYSAVLGWPAPTHAQVRGKIIYSFQDPESDRFSSSDLAADRAGDLYGVLGPDSRTDCSGVGCGTIYRLVPPAAPGGSWTKETLYELPQSSGGSVPTGKPLLDASGNLYGTTFSGGRIGGQRGTGTVWELSPPPVAGGSWTFQVLHTFSGPDGANPAGALVMDRSGTLYGTAAFGGALKGGVAFALAPPTSGGAGWTQTVLHSFGALGDGVNPYESLVLSGDEQSLFGAVAHSAVQGRRPLRNGPGVAFRLQRQESGWTYALIFRFPTVARAPQGAYPQTLLADRNDNLFGTAVGGGFQTGTVFELSPPIPGQTAWTEQVLHSFDFTDGALPVGALVMNGQTAALFGSAYQGGTAGAVDGSKGNGGVLFRLDPPPPGTGTWSYTVLHAFSGAYPRKGGAGSPRAPTVGRGKRLFMVTDAGGQYGDGTIFVHDRR